uniref:NADH-ubiquinone oxidoreductase chain 4 n=1 Tax=Gammarus roeselii TaxID=1080772 RepID=A0A343VUL8_9CRUS|nr:NADH dehydrogenase subunit 4 [Gammarus roeselii]AVP50040.1 NADH dehydrogenase subunit 4 [Gammarus roeselii]
MCSSDSSVWKSCGAGEMDYVGWSLSILSLWVIMLATMGSVSIKKGNWLSSGFVGLNMGLVSVLLLSFYVSDFMFFYVGFESCLIPIFFLILGWGYQPERAQAGIYMFLYTLFGSLPLFFLIIKGMNGGFSYMHNESSTYMSGFFYIFMLGAFLIKFPLYSVHLWLLKAHVEAPVAGSMILAGVLLKLGGYGIIRFLPMWGQKLNNLSEFIICVSVWGGVIMSLSCLRQMDMKLLIASSSVVHMSMCISGLLILSEWGLKGTMAVMLAHGLCSSGLFYLANVSYERSYSRSLVVNKGLLSLMPSMSLWWFLLLSANMSAPPTLNLLGEIFLLSVLVSWSNYIIIVLAMLSFFSAGYSIYLFSLSQHGVYLSSKSGYHSGKLVEYMVVSCHWMPLNMVSLCLFWVI